MKVKAIDWSVRGKKNIIKELYYRGEEKHGEKRERERERERERSMGRWEIRASDSEGLRTEERKSERAYHKREKVPKNYVSRSYRWI